LIRSADDGIVVVVMNGRLSKKPIVGEIVTETFDYDDGRQVSVYVPPDPPEAIVFAGDREMISQWRGTLESDARDQSDHQ
jgi:hypothetical protein